MGNWSGVCCIIMFVHGRFVEKSRYTCLLFSCLKWKSYPQIITMYCLIEFNSSSLAVLQNQEVY